MSELITIIVPIYKVEDYLRRCVDSILNQSYKNLEIILVDDGSPDRCGEICDAYANVDKRIKVIHKKNGGLSDARNIGIEIAQGKYVSFIDSDDWISREYVEKLYKLLINNNADISVCNFIKTLTETLQVEHVQEEIYKYSNVEALEQLYDKFSVQMVIACGKLYKRNLFDDIRFPVGRIHEDEFTTYRLIYKANQIVLTTEPLLYYWQREDSITGVGFSIKNKLHAIDAFLERAEFLKKNDLENLSSKTYRLLFGFYRDINKKKFLIEDPLIEQDFNKNFRDFKKLIRKSKQSVIYRMFYELYFITPKTMEWIRRIYGKVRGES